MQTKNNVDQQEFEHVVTPGYLVMQRFLRNRLAIVGLILLLILMIFCYIGPYLSPYGEYQLFYQKDGVEFASDQGDINADGVKLLDKQPPSAKHWLGTNRDGQDMLTRLMYGGRISLMIGFVCVIIELTLGALMGGLAGYFGGWVDMVIMRLVEIFFCIPHMALVLIVSSVLMQLKIPQNYQIYVLMLVLGVLGWSSVARLVRGQILSLREQEYMIAAEATGLRPFRRIIKHLVPNVAPQLIVYATLSIGGTILYESTLSFLGLGVPPPYASWGNMVDVVRDTRIFRNNLSMWVPPGLCILLAVLAFNFVGDGLRDAFDPKMKR